MAADSSAVNGAKQLDSANLFCLDARLGYFRNGGVNVMAFDDTYPEGHQGGVGILMHGRRVATCGDVRFEPTPGQWQPVPQQLDRALDADAGTIVTVLRYPNPNNSLRGFNPMLYPDVELQYRVTVRADGASVVVDVDLDRPAPEAFAGKLCFNLELFPGALFGKPWIMDGQFGLFPRQPNGPVKAQACNYAHSGHQRPDPASGPFADREQLAGPGRGYSPIVADDWIAEPYARGRVLTLCPDDDATRLKLECLTPGADIALYDGRMNHNNGWFVASSAIPAGRAEGALRWRITPNAIPGWRSPTVVQVSQVGYHPDQAKRAVVELDPEAALPALKARYDALCAETPYGLPYRPGIWGAGWGIQAMAFRYYFLHRAFPELLEYPFLWQQTEYVMGGGSSHFMFLALAVQSLLKAAPVP